MKLNDIKIGVQLRLGLAIIVLFVLVMGVLARMHTDLIWQQLQTMYDHPLQVRRAVGALEADILKIQRNIRDVIISNNQTEVTSLSQEIAVYKADAARQFEVIFDRYLGPRTDVVALHDDYTRWTTIHDGTIRLMQAGNYPKAANRIKDRGVGDKQADVLLAHLLTIDVFARKKGDQLLETASQLYKTLNSQLILILAIILGTSLLISWWLHRQIKTPLTELTRVTEAFRQGDRDVRAAVTTTNEFGVVANSYNSLADSIQTQMQINDKTTLIADAMLRADEMRQFCQTVLQSLVEHTGSQVGAVYFLNEAKTEFEHFESIGLGTEARKSFSATSYDGELGTALSSRQIQHIKEIPSDTRFSFAAVVGDMVPREIMTIPVMEEQEVIAVISLSSIRAYDEPTLQLINDIYSVLTARLNGILAYQQTRLLAERLEHQYREVDTQKRELEMQARELVGQNSELEMQKRQLDEANQLKSTFLSNMSHELRTPLNSVIALSGVLSRRLQHTVPEEEYSYLEVIERNGKSLLSLINDILDLSRIESGHEDINTDRFSFHELTNEIVDMIEPQLLTKSVTLISLVGDELPLISSDVDKCRHILQNLVSNAVKFTETGCVEISARQVGDELMVSVRDTGIGISAEQLPHIFDEFRQADDSTSRKYGGTGLGLTIARKYAELLGGGIDVDSTVGLGSTFTLRLPIVHDLSRTGTPMSSEPYIKPQSKTANRVTLELGRHILLVEDNEPAIIQLTDILHSEGYEISIARNGSEALQQIELNLPDAMILDLMMPEVDGFEVLQTIRSMERTAHIPVLILTAKHVTKQELSFLKSNHIHQLIQKGDINKQDLLASVAQMVAPAPTEPVQRRRPTHTGKPVILVVEDNEDNMRTTNALLYDRYELIEAEDGKIGVEKARIYQPDLILMDISMPVMDGIQALKEIRDDEGVADIPVIALTASAMSGNKEQILAHGFDGYLSKPVDVDQLYRILHEALYGGK